MRYRPLGNTGLQVSVLGYGASPLGGVFGDTNEAEGIRSVHAALDAGINFLDVAPYYGLTKAETTLGQALKGIARDRYLLSTKVGRYASDEFDFSAARVTRSVEESLTRLGIEHIDVIHCHDIEFVPLEQVLNAALPALRHLQTQGKVRFVSVSGLPLGIFPAILKQAALDVILSYCHYTLQDQTLEALVPSLRAQEVGIINASPLCMGLLTDNPLPAWHPAPETMREVCARAAAHCRARGSGLATLGMQFALANPDFATTLAGMPSVTLVKQNLAALETPPDPTLLAEVQAILAPIYNRTWSSGLPENNMGIPLLNGAEGNRAAASHEAGA